MKNIYFFLILTILSACSDDSSGDCPDPGQPLRFNLVDEQTNHNLVFGEHAIYNFDDLKLYSTWPPRYEGDTDTIFYYNIGKDLSDNYIQTIIDGTVDEIYLELNEHETDTLTSIFSINSRDRECEYYQIDMVKYNGNIVCEGCHSLKVYTIYK